MMHSTHRFFRRLSFNVHDSSESSPLEFFRDIRRQSAPRGEARLALAVLEDAVGCLINGHDPWEIPHRLFRWEAQQWINSRDRGTLFAFENVCSFLHLESEEMRSRIRRWCAQETEKSSTPFATSA
jgi:hypothetical protein